MDHTGKRFRKLSYPYRYRYDLLRALECLADLRVAYYTRIQPAIDWLQVRSKKDGLWYLENQRRGNVHFSMEEVGEPSRFIALKALYVFRHFQVS